MVIQSSSHWWLPIFYNSWVSIDSRKPSLNICNRWSSGTPGLLDPGRWEQPPGPRSEMESSPELKLYLSSSERQLSCATTCCQRSADDLWTCSWNWFEDEQKFTCYIYMLQVVANSSETNIMVRRIRPTTCIALGFLSEILVNFRGAQFGPLSHIMIWFTIDIRVQYTTHL